MTNEQELEHAYGRIHILEERIASLKNTQASLMERGIQLEELCRDMYASIKRWWLWIPDAEFSKHSDLMKELGLIDRSE